MEINKISKIGLGIFAFGFLAMLFLIILSKPINNGVAIILNLGLIISLIGGVIYKFSNPL